MEIVYNKNLEIYNTKNIGKSIIQILLYSNLELPRYILVIFMIFILAIAALNIKNEKKVLLKILWIYIIDIIACIPLMIYFYGSDIVISGRMLWSMGAIIGMSLIIFYSDFEDKNWKNIVIFASIIYTSCMLYGMNNLIYRYKAGNEIDRSICEELDQLRLKVEKEEKKNIDKIIIKEEYTRKWITNEI